MQETNNPLSSVEIRALLLETLSYEQSDIDSEGKTFKKYGYQGTKPDLYRLAEGLAIKKGLISNKIKVSEGAWGGSGVLLHAGLTTNFSESDIRYIYEQFHLLLNQGIIAPGAIGNYGSDLPSFHVTDYGKQVLEGNGKTPNPLITDELCNLLISGDEVAWESDSVIFEISRCIREYTDKDLVDKYSKLGTEEIDFVKSLPCIFAYEDKLSKDAYIGHITDIVVRKAGVKIFFKKEEKLFLEDFRKLDFELDIGKWEANRTHWALKKVNLRKELLRIRTTPHAAPQSSLVDITKHYFDVAFTFAGESRLFVEQLLNELEKQIDKATIFYDNYYQAQLARPSLDKVLQDIYRNRSKLVVAVLCERYQEKLWCGIEFRAVQEMIMDKENDKIMFIRTDHGHVDGIFKTDGFIDADKHTPQDIATFIIQRINLLK